MKNYTRRLTDRPIRAASKKLKIILLFVAVLACLCLLFPPKAASTPAPEVTPAPEEPAERIEPAKVKYTQAQLDQWKAEKEAVVTAKLATYFAPEDARVALAIIKQESDLNSKATNYNCWYSPEGVAHETKQTGDKSRPCKTEDRPLTWSVDCGISQVNFAGKKECPEYAYDLDWNLKKMAEMHAERGFTPWVAYTKKLYIPYLK